jgi:hypothetical protein
MLLAVLLLLLGLLTWVLAVQGGLQCCQGLQSRVWMWQQ